MDQALRYLCDLGLPVITHSQTGHGSPHHARKTATATLHGRPGAGQATLRAEALLVKPANPPPADLDKRGSPQAPAPEQGRPPFSRHVAPRYSCSPPREESSPRVKSLISGPHHPSLCLETGKHKHTDTRTALAHCSRGASIASAPRVLFT